MTQIMEENNVEKVENADYQHFSLSSKAFEGLLRHVETRNCEAN